MQRFLLIIFMLLIYLGLSAQGNSIVIVAEYKATRQCSTDSTLNIMTYSIREDILRLDMKGSNANSSIIYQPSTDKLWVVYHHEQVYYSMTGDEMRQLEAMVIQQSDEFKRSLDLLDSSARAEKLSIWPGGDPFLFADPEYKLVNKKDSLISQLLCDRYEGINQNGNLSVFYSNSLKTTGLKESELNILKQFSDFMGKGVKALSGSMDFSNIYKKDVGDFPILIENYSGSSLCNHLWLKFIYRDNLPNSFFEIPIQFGKMDNPLGNR